MIDKNLYLFDMDGTIIDSYAGIRKCAEYAADKLGYSVKEEDYDLFIGGPLEVSFEKYAGMDKKTALKAVEEYRELYLKEGIYMFEVYDKIESTFKELKKRNKQIALTTLKPDFMAEDILKKAGLYEYFDAIVGSNINKNIHSKKDVIKQVFNKLNVEDLSKVVLIGDTIYDLEGADEVGIDCVIVDYGFGSEETKKKSYKCIKTMNEVLDIWR